MNQTLSLGAKLYLYLYMHIYAHCLITLSHPVTPKLKKYSVMWEILFTRGWCHLVDISV